MNDWTGCDSLVDWEQSISLHDKVEQVFAALNSKQLLAGEIVAMDGKKVRGFHGRRCCKSAIHMVSAFVHGHGITLRRWETE